MNHMKNCAAAPTESARERRARRLFLRCCSPASGGAGGMFSLLYGFWKILFRKAEFHIIILGLDAAGKTSCLERLKTIFTGLEALAPNRIPPTVGLNIGRMRINRTQITFWDLGGQRGLRSLWEKYFTEAHGLLYIVDSADRSRLDESRDVLRGLLHNPDLAGIPVLVFANKQDSPGAMTPHEIQTHFGLHQQQIDDIGTSQKQNVLGVTALTGDGVEEGIRWLVDAVRTSPRALALSGGEGWASGSGRSIGTAWATEGVGAPV